MSMLWCHTTVVKLWAICKITGALGICLWEYIGKPLNVPLWIFAYMYLELREMIYFHFIGHSEWLPDFSWVGWGTFLTASEGKNSNTLGTSFVNSLWPSDNIWRHRTGSTLAQVMVCCLTAPSHYLNQCWLIISKALRHSSEGNFTKDTSAIKHKKIARKLLIKNFIQIS